MAEAPQLSEECKAAIIADTESAYATWKAGCTEEQKAAAHAMMERYNAEPAFKAEKMTQVNQMFTDADTNGDGILDRSEWAVFHQKSNEMKVAEGNYVDDRADREQTKYAVLNLINPAQEGVTMADIRQSMVAAHPRWEELRIADGL